MCAHKLLSSTTAFFLSQVVVATKQKCEKACQQKHANSNTNIKNTNNKRTWSHASILMVDPDSITPMLTSSPVDPGRFPSHSGFNEFATVFVDLVTLPDVN